MINPCQHHAATLETDFTQLDWQLSEHSELMVEYQAPLVTFLLVLCVKFL